MMHAVAAAPGDGLHPHALLDFVFCLQVVSLRMVTNYAS